MKELKRYLKMAQDNPKVTACVIIAIVIIISLVG